MAIGLLLASCSAPTVPVDRPVAVKVEVPAHLEQPAAEPATDPATLRTNGDLMVAFGDWVTWGRTVATQMTELAVADRSGERAGGAASEALFLPRCPKGGWSVAASVRSSAAKVQ